jgi:hypothetical protein
VKADVLLYNPDPVFHSLSWEALDLMEGVSTRVVRRKTEMASLAMMQPVDLLVFDDPGEENLETALSFRHHFPHFAQLALITAKPARETLGKARDQGISLLRHTDSLLLLRWKLRRFFSEHRGSFSGKPSQDGTEESIGYSLSGDITVFAPTDVLQMTCMSGRNGRFNFISAQGRAEVFVKDGALHHATLGQLSGEEVLARVCRWNAGRFYFEQGALAGQRTIQRPTDHVLVDALKQRDEAETLMAVDDLNLPDQ